MVPEKNSIVLEMQINMLKGQATILCALGKTIRSVEVLGHTDSISTNKYMLSNTIEEEGDTSKKKTVKLSFWFNRKFIYF